MSTLDPELEALLGTTVGGKYRLDEAIGRGGMGAVFRATNTTIGKRVALKFLYRETARDRDAVSRFQREAEAASAVESAHIVEIFDSGTTDDGLPFLVMELLRGEDLRARLRREGRISVSEAVQIGGQVARALRRAHEAGIVHRDLKPDNVFLCSRDDDPMFVKLVDFGISKITRKAAGLDTLTRKGLVLGTAFYMSPEQAQAKADVDGRTDLFSLGAILFEALARRPPHTGQAYEAVLISICTQDAPDVRKFAPEIPSALAGVISKALARNRDDRFQTAQQLYEALAEAVPGVLTIGGQRSEPVVAIGDPAAVATPPSGSTETAENAAVRPALVAATSPVRRTVVAAAVAALVAFSVTVFVMARLVPDRQAATGAEPPVPAGTVTPTELASSSAVPTPPSSSAPTPVDSESAPSSASGAPSSPAPPTPLRPAAGTNSPPARTNSPTNQRTPAPRPTAGGVANGLQLATEP